VLIHHLFDHRSRPRWTTALADQVMMGNWTVVVVPFFELSCST
jgi:hypothetical protein